MNFFQDGGGRHLGFVRTGNSAIRSAVPENPTLEPNIKWIGPPVAEIWPFAYRYVGGKYKYKIAIKNAALAFEWDLDELSEHYLRKDMEQFWKKMETTVFQKKFITVTYWRAYRP